LRIKTPVESGTLINILLQDCLSLHLIRWGFIRLPLIPTGFSTGIPSILMLKNQLLRAFLHHLALPNLSQNFLLNPKPLRAYLSGFWRMIDSIFISSFIAWSLNLPFRLPHQSQILSDLISLGLALISFILADEFHQPLVLFHLLYVNIKLPLHHPCFTTGILLIPALLNLFLQTSFCIAWLFRTCLRTSS